MSGSEWGHSFSQCVQQNGSQTTYHLVTLSLIGEGSHRVDPCLTQGAQPSASPHITTSNKSRGSSDPGPGSSCLESSSDSWPRAGRVVALPAPHVGHTKASLNLLRLSHSVQLQDPLARGPMTPCSIICHSSLVRPSLGF